MILVITPLVKEAQAAQRARLILYVVGALLVSTAVGLTVAWTGELLPDLGSFGPGLLVGLNTIYGLREVGIVSLPLPSSSYQVPRSWMAQGDGAALAYGMAMGSGLITRAPFASFHLYLVALLVSASPMTGAVAGLLFGLCRVLAVMPPVAMALYRGQGTLERARGVLAYAGVTHALNGLALAFVAAYLTCSIVTGVSR